MGDISGGTFNGEVTSTYYLSKISGGVFNGYVNTTGSISGGVFYGDVPEDKIEVDSTVYTVTFDLNGGSGSIPNQEHPAFAINRGVILKDEFRSHHSRCFILGLVTACFLC